MTSSQEFAIENMKDKGSRIERQTGRRRKTLRDLQAFLVWNRRRNALTGSSGKKSAGCFSTCLI